MGITIFLLIIIFIIIVLVSRNNKLSSLQKTLIILGFTLLVIISFAIMFVNGFERGRDPKPEDKELEEKQSVSLKPILDKDKFCIADFDNNQIYSLRI